MYNRKDRCCNCQTLTQSKICLKFLLFLTPTDLFLVYLLTLNRLISYFLLYGLTLDFNMTLFSQLAPPAKGSKEELLWNGITMLTPAKHKCSHVPNEIRQEADLLKMDFNSRVKSVLFNSMVCAYYVGFVPICFLQVTITPCSSKNCICNWPWYSCFQESTVNLCV